MASYNKRFPEKEYPPCVATENLKDPLTDFELLSHVMGWARVYFGLSFSCMIGEMLAGSDDGSYTKEQYELLDSLSKDDGDNS